MNTFLFFSALVAACRAGTVAVAPAALAAAPVAGPVAAASYIVRAPSHDSASIEHHRLGGNFAYSTAEAHAFAQVTPQISSITHPVAETIHTHVPEKIATVHKGDIVKTTHVAEPVFKHVPTYAQVPVHGVVREHQTYHQPIVTETRTHHVQAVSHVAAAPAVAHVAAAPAVAAVNYAAAAPVAAVNYAAAAPAVAAVNYAAAAPAAFNYGAHPAAVVA